WLLEQPEAVREQAERERDREADRDGDEHQLEMLDEGGAERIAPVRPHPVPAEDVIAGDARAALAERRNDGARAAHNSSPASRRRKTPSTRPSSSSTTRGSLLFSS